jgi:hypothetical protein
MPLMPLRWLSLPLRFSLAAAAIFFSLIDFHYLLADACRQRIHDARRALPAAARRSAPLFARSAFSPTSACLIYYFADAAAMLILRHYCHYAMLIADAISLFSLIIDSPLIYRFHYCFCFDISRLLIFR